MPRSLAPCSIRIRVRVISQGGCLILRSKVWGPCSRPVQLAWMELLNTLKLLNATETIDEVGARVFEQVRRVASGEEMAKAEEHKHREFQFWAEQTVSL